MGQLTVTVVLIAIVGAAILLVGFLIYVVQRQQRSRLRSSDRSLRTERARQRPASPPISFPSASQVSPKVQRKLFSLLRGDRAAVERLIAHAKARNPGQSEGWYWEKVIFDLERDRRI
jgi:hypothetical protein